MKKTAKKKAMTKPISFMMRMEKELHDDLKREAEAEGRSLANYMRHLLSTDPRRNKK